MSGWESQEAGDWGENVVKAALSDGRITSAPLDPDLGEDFLIEVAGREASATGKHPRTALIQVKACFEECTADEIKVPGIKKTKLMRWSSQQLPVFIVAVSGYSTRTPSFFVKAVDEVFAGVEIRDMPTESVTVTAIGTNSLADSLVAGIDNFHRSVCTDLNSLSSTDKRNEHFEVMQRGKPNPIDRLVKHVSWSVIWRASRRPAYFAAMISNLFREAHEIYADLDAPAYVSFHVYRSQYDMDHNMAIARVHWIDELHNGIAEVEPVLSGNNPRIEYLETHPDIRKFVKSKITDAESFVAHLKSIAPKLDGFASRLVAAEFDGEKGKQFWDDQRIMEMDELERVWEATPLAPTEFKAVEDVLSSYVYALTGHRVFAGKAHWNLKGENKRYRLETAEEIQYYYGAWWVLLKNSGWDFPYYWWTKSV